MRFSQKILHHPAFLISLLLAAFFLKGVFLVTLFPMFTGQDEARHYNTLQYLNQPEIPAEQKTRRLHIKNKDDFTEYNFSEEILYTGKSVGIDDIRGGLFDTQRFAQDSFDGNSESDILAKTWRPYNFLAPADVAGTTSLYHKLASRIEQALSGENILVRFYSARILSVFLGTLGVFFAYLIARAIGFSALVSTLFAALVAFQPKYAMYMTNINYDALLIPLFFLFTWGSILSLRDGVNAKNTSIMVTAIILGIMTKGTAIILLVVFLGLIGFHFFKKAKGPRAFLLLGGVFIMVLIGANLLLETRYSLLKLLPIEGSLSRTIISLGEYLGESLTLGRFGLSSRTYWGALSWNGDIIANHFTDMLWPLQFIAFTGIILLLFSKRIPDFLPSKKNVIFLLVMIVALQLGIRLADWNVFASTGSLDLGTPGRYFLPNLATHLILVFVGFGMLLGKREYFKNILLGGVILMFFFSFYLTFDVILPRFYL